MSVSKTHPNWLAYVDFVNGIVVRGLSKLVLRSLQHLAQQLDTSYIKKNGVQPMLVLKLQLDADASFIEATPGRRAAAARQEPLAALLRVATPAEVEELEKDEAEGAAGGAGAYGGGDEENGPLVRRVPLVRFDPDVLEEEEMDEEKQLQRALLKAAGMLGKGRGGGGAGDASTEEDEERRRATIWSIVNGWVESFYQAAA